MIQETRKYTQYNEKGIAQIPLMVGLLLMALAVPVATKLAQKNQNLGSQASGGYDDCMKKCASYGNTPAAVTCVDNCYSKYPTSTPTCQSKCKSETIGEAAYNACVSNECDKSTPTKAPGGTLDDGSTSSASNDSSDGSKTVNKSKCTADSKPPADKCGSTILSINAQCLNSKWDYDDQTCNSAGRVEVCGGKQYCCPSKGGKWTTKLTKCPDACLDCPKDFTCYQKDTDLKWFVTGYVPSGYAKVATTKCTSKKIAKPTFKGKLRGDSNCDGLINNDDFEVWKEEFLTGKGDSNNFEADFTGKNGKCDKKVNGYDYSLWRREYIDLKGK